MTPVLSLASLCQSLAGLVSRPPCIQVAGPSQPVTCTAAWHAKGGGSAAGGAPRLVAARRAGSGLRRRAGALAKLEHLSEQGAECRQQWVVSGCQYPGTLTEPACMLPTRPGAEPAAGQNAVESGICAVVKSDGPSTTAPQPHGLRHTRGCRARRLEEEGYKSPSQLG